MHGVRVPGVSLLGGETASLDANEAADDAAEGQADRAVLRSVDQLFSRHLPEIVQLFASDGMPRLSPDDAARIDELVIGPVREISDRGGKGWRSNLMLVSCEAFGGDASVLLPWVGVVELLHVGSLIVDDVQDHAAVRRGGASCHLLHGVPLAINAGNCAYFLFDRMVEQLPIDEHRKLRIYRAYFETMRSAHAGQAMDIAGALERAERALAAGEVSQIVDAVAAAHLRKTGAAVALCVLVGAVVAGADEALVEKAARYGATMGLAFQIGDDILDVVGFAGGTKAVGGDIAAGKITYPIALALERLPETRRQGLMQRLRARDASPDNIRAVRELLDSVKACEAAHEVAEHALSRDWAALSDGLVPGEGSVLLREYGQRALKRHY